MGFSSHVVEDERASVNVMAVIDPDVERSLVLYHIELRPPECQAGQRRGPVCVLLRDIHGIAALRFLSFNANCYPESTSCQDGARVRLERRPPGYNYQLDFPDDFGRRND